MKSVSSSYLPSWPLSAVALSLVGLGLFVPVSAQQASSSAAHNVLPAVVVSGSRQEQAADDLPVSSDVISDQRISDRQNGSLREALEDLPNVYVKSGLLRPNVTATTTGSAWRDGNLGINIRGLGGNRVLMLMDGVRLPRSYAFRTNSFDRESLTLEQLKRIEVVRGPASALYGSDGMAGLINFITYQPEDFLRGPDGTVSRSFGGRASIGWNQEDRGWRLGSTIAGQASDTVQWMLSGSVRRGHGLDTRGNNGAANELRTRPDPQTHEDASLLGKLVVRPNARQRHVLSLEHVQRDADYELLSSRSARDPLQPGDVLDENVDQSSQRDRFTWDARYGVTTPWADHLRTVVAVQRSHSTQHGVSQRFSAPLRVRDIDYWDRGWQLGLQADKVLRHGDWTHRLVYGVDYTRSRIRNLWDGLDPNPPETFPLKRFPDTRETTSALYLQDETVIGDWSFTPGLRFDHFSIDVTSQDGYHPPAAQPGQSVSGSAVSPKFGVLWRATPEWSVFGQYATGFRAPEAGHLNGYLEVDRVNAIVLSNPDLKPEKSRGIEVGVRGRMERLSLDASVFASNYSNLISELEAVNVYMSGGMLHTEFQTINKARARISGFEIKGEYDWGRVGEGRLRTPFSYGRTRGVDRDTRKPINSVHPAQLTLGARYDTAVWSLFLDGRYQAAKKSRHIDSTAYVDASQGEQFAPRSATVFDLGAQWRLRPGVRLNFAVHNITNRKYWLWPDVHGRPAGSADIDAYTQPGRSVRISLVADF